MMLLVGALIATHLQYDFPVGQLVPYTMSVKFQGYLPVLGGKDSSVEVNLKIAVAGQPLDALGHRQVRSEIEDLKMVLNGAAMPFGVKNIQTFFPPTTISLTPEGRILKTDAPDAKLAVQLPGLDVKRFPDICYLPIEFPVEGVESGMPFKFKKTFGASDAEYVVVPTKISEAEVDLDVTVTQDYGVLEDDRGTPVTSGSEARYKLTTHVSGKGTAVFDRKRNLVVSAHIQSDAQTHTLDLKGGVMPDRDLKTELSVNVSKQ